MSKKHLVVLAVTLVLLVPGGAFGAGAPEEEFRMRMSTNLGPEGTVGKALTHLGELIEERSEGRIATVVNHGAEMGTQHEQVEMAMDGSLELGVFSPGTALGPYVEQLALFDLSYVYEDEEHYVRTIRGIEDEVSRLLEPYNLMAVGGQNMGFRHMLIEPRPVYRPQDLEGLVMRGPNPMYVAMFEAFGADGVTTDWTEIYTALQTGVIDGMEASPDMILSMRFHEVANHLSLTNHQPAGVFYFINTDWLDSLPEDLQELVLDTARDAADYQIELDRVAQEEALQTLIDEGVEVNEVADISEFMEKVEGLHEEYVQRGPHWEDFYNKLLEAGAAN